MKALNRTKNFRFLDFRLPSHQIDPYHLLVLNDNRPVSPLYERLISRAKSVICVDGGANYHRKFVEANKDRSNLLMPKLVIGDLDSASKETLTLFKQHGTEIILDPGQNTNDLEKALLYLGSNLNDDQGSEKLVIWPGVTRLDHIMLPNQL